MSVLLKLTQARAHVGAVAKTQTADTGSYTYTYASLGDVIRTVDAACEEAGLTWIQQIDPMDDDSQRYQLQTILIDTESGETMVVGGPLGPVKGDPQAMGSALTYYRRYALVTTFGLVVEDDDGQRAATQERDPHGRTTAETQTRELIAGLSKDERAVFVAEFKAHFGCGLTDLPTGRHGDALGWTKQWIDGADKKAVADPGHVNDSDNAPEEAHQ